MILHGDATQGILILLHRPLSHQRDLALALNSGQRIVQLMRSITDKSFLTLIGKIDPLHHLSGIATTDPVYANRATRKSNAQRKEKPNAYTSLQSRCPIGDQAYTDRYYQPNNS